MFEKPGLDRTTVDDDADENKLGRLSDGKMRKFP